MEKISIIIPYYQCLPYLTECVAAICQHTCYPVQEIVIVNDGSPDGKALRAWGQKAQRQCPIPLQIVQRQENHGFAYTCNQGAQCASGDWLIFLNADTAPHDGWLETLLQFALSHSDCGVAGALLLYPENNLVQHAGGAFDADLEPFHLYQGEPSYLPCVRKNRACQWVTGACMLVAKADFLALGGFDISYGSAAEDLDFCFRMRATLGKQAYVVGDSVLTHVSNVTGVTAANFNAKKAIFRQRWQHQIHADADAIYAADGFTPELLAALGRSGSNGQFWRLALFLAEMKLITPEQQRLYLTTHDIAALRTDWQRCMGSITEQPVAAPQRSKKQRAATAPHKIAINHLFQHLQHIDALHGPHRETFATLLHALDGAQLFFYCYSLASLYLRHGQTAHARLLFTFLSQTMPGFNDELAGKAYFKLAQMAGSARAKAALLQKCTALYPPHQLAHEQLQQLSSHTKETCHDQPTQ